MSLMRTLTIAAVLAAGSMLPGMPVSSTSAQPAESVARAGVRLPTCDPSMIVGTWQAAFAYGTPIYGTAQNNGFSCPLTVATDGTITSGTCILGSGITVSPVLVGT